MRPEVQGFFDEATNTVSYVVTDPETRCCAVIDPVLDFDPASGRTGTGSADKIADFIASNNLAVDWLLETHVHADHLSGSPYLKERFGGQMAIGAQIVAVQEVFADVFNAGNGFARDGSQFDRLFADGDSFHIGRLTASVLHTPGHNPACVTYLIGDAAFVGDTLFMPDYGTARCDFPGGSADQLWESIQRVLSLPQETRLFMCHDYKAPGRDSFAWETTVAEQKAQNVHIGRTMSKERFVTMRIERDKTLSMPRLIIPSIQVNMRGGHMPEAEGNGVTYLKTPINRL